MRAVFVIDDIPNELDVNDLLIDYCVHTKGEYKTIRKGGNHPLKPLPQKKDIDKTLAFGGYENIIQESLARGYNACLEEITK